MIRNKFPFHRTITFFRDSTIKITSKKLPPKRSIQSGIEIFPLQKFTLI